MKENSLGSNEAMLKPHSVQAIFVENVMSFLDSSRKEIVTIPSDSLNAVSIDSDNLDLFFFEIDSLSMTISISCFLFLLS